MEMAKAKLPKFLKRYFWEVDYRKINLQQRAEYVVKRILEYGDKRAIRWMEQNFKEAKIKEVICGTKDLSAQSANYWAVVLGVDKKKVKCLQKHYLEIRRSYWPY